MCQTVNEEIGGPRQIIQSEGFIAFQDNYKDESLLLNSDAGMFFEFVPAGEIFEDNPTRLSIGQVKTGIDYAIIINSNAGLWGYNIGDTIRFSCLNP